MSYLSSEEQPSGHFFMSNHVYPDPNSNFFVNPPRIITETSQNPHPNKSSTKSKLFKRRHILRNRLKAKNRGIGRLGACTVYIP